MNPNDEPAAAAETAGTSGKAIDYFNTAVGPDGLPIDELANAGQMVYEDMKSTTSVNTGSPMPTEVGVDGVPEYDPSVVEATEEPALDAELPVETGDASIEDLDVASGGPPAVTGGGGAEEFPIARRANVRGVPRFVESTFITSTTVAPAGF